MTYTPDNWVVLKLQEDNSEIIYKILCGWSGGYTTGDSWKINSGIVRIVETKDYYLVHGYSGSVYECNKNSEVLRMNCAFIYNSIKQSYPETEIVDITDILSIFKDESIIAKSSE